MGAMSQSPRQSGMSRPGCELLSLRIYPSRGDEPATSSVRYKPTEMGVTFIKELPRWG